MRVERNQEGQRLDNFLLRELKGVPRSRVYRFIRRGEVRVNKKRSKADFRLSYGDQVRIPPYAGPDEKPAVAPGEELQQRLQDSLLFENDACLVLNKPAGLPVHGGSGISLGLIEALRQMRPEWRHLELAHRLDRDTSGCLVVAKNPQFLKPIQDQFKARTVLKTYLALVHGDWSESIDEINAPLKKNEPSSGERVVKVDPAGKAACTRFQVRERFGSATLLEVRPETGRTHQIRVHCQTGGHPIVGDERYILRRHREQAEPSLLQVRHLCLHAWKIRFRPQPDAEPVSLEARLDSRFQGLLERIGRGR